MNKNLIEAKRRALTGAERLRELHGDILGSGKYQEIYLDADAIFEDIHSKLTMAMDEIDNTDEGVVDSETLSNMWRNSF